MPLIVYKSNEREKFKARMNDPNPQGKRFMINVHHNFETAKKILPSKLTEVGEDDIISIPIEFLNDVPSSISDLMLIGEDTNNDFFQAVFEHFPLITSNSLENLKNVNQLMLHCNIEQMWHFNTNIFKPLLEQIFLNITTLYFSLRSRQDNEESEQIKLEFAKKIQKWFSEQQWDSKETLTIILDDGENFKVTGSMHTEPSPPSLISTSESSGSESADSGSARSSPSSPPLKRKRTDSHAPESSTLIPTPFFRPSSPSSPPPGPSDPDAEMPVPPDFC